MGGYENGSQASRRTAELMKDVLESIESEEGIESLLIKEIKRIDKEVKKEYAAADNGGSGTTLAAALIFGKHMHWIGVGDSRIYIIRGEEIVQVTQDHTYKMQLRRSVEKGLIPSGFAEKHPQRNALTSYIGSGDIKYISTNKAGLDLKPGDIVLLCSDGLVKSLDDGRISKIIRDCLGDMNAAARQLTVQAFDSSDGSKDNTTVVLMKFNE